MIPRNYRPPQFIAIGDRCVAARVEKKITVRERRDGARVRPNLSRLLPQPLGHCWDGQTRLAPVSLTLSLKLLQTRRGLFAWLHGVSSVQVHFSVTERLTQ